MVLPEPYFSLSDSRDTSCAIRFFSEPVPQLRDSWDNTWCYRKPRRYFHLVVLFQQEGLRTLCFSSRELNQSEYDDFHDQLQEASTALENRDEKVCTPPPPPLLPSLKLYKIPNPLGT